MLYNAVLVSTAQQSESALCTHIAPLFGFPSHLGHHRALGSLSYTTSSHQLSILYIVNAGDSSSIPGWGRSPGEGNGNPLQYSCLGNPKDRGVWQATVHGVSESRTRLRAHAHQCISVNLHLPMHPAPTAHLVSIYVSTFVSISPLQIRSSIPFF